MISFLSILLLLTIFSTIKLSAHYSPSSSTCLLHHPRRPASLVFTTHPPAYYIRTAKNLSSLPTIFTDDFQRPCCLRRRSCSTTCAKLSGWPSMFLPSMRSFSLLCTTSSICTHHAYVNRIMFDGSRLAVIYCVPLFGPGLFVVGIRITRSRTQPLVILINSQPALPLAQPMEIPAPFVLIIPISSSGHAVLPPSDFVPPRAVQLTPLLTKANYRRRFGNPCVLSRPASTHESRHYSRSNTPSFCRRDGWCCKSLAVELADAVVLLGVELVMCVLGGELVRQH